MNCRRKPRSLFLCDLGESRLDKMSSFKFKNSDDSSGTSGLSGFFAGKLCCRFGKLCNCMLIYTCIGGKCIAVVESGDISVSFDASSKGACSCLASL
mmetsp:Transcript_5959/g.7220  ORF Transcript_5959/g.7220 Transcript_5959/m.7220 type:complete len:97 (+) Transcript_5959:1169-1459(+)